VTGGDTDHYTIEDSIKEERKNFKKNQLSNKKLYPVISDLEVSGERLLEAKRQVKNGDLLARLSLQHL
jgi:hypothetical protein